MPKHNKPLSGGNNWNRKPDKIKHNKKRNNNPWSQNYGQEEESSVYGNNIPSYKYSQPQLRSPEELLSPIDENGQKLANFASRVAVNVWQRKPFVPPQSRLSFSNEKSCNCDKEQKNDFLGEYSLPHSRTGLSADKVLAWEQAVLNRNHFRLPSFRQEAVKTCLGVHVMDIIAKTKDDNTIYYTHCDEKTEDLPNTKWKFYHVTKLDSSFFTDKLTMNSYDSLIISLHGGSTYILDSTKTVVEQTQGSVCIGMEVEENNEVKNHNVNSKFLAEYLESDKDYNQLFDGGTGRNPVDWERQVKAKRAGTIFKKIFRAAKPNAKILFHSCDLAKEGNYFANVMAGFARYIPNFESMTIYLALGETIDHCDQTPEFIDSHNSCYCAPTPPEIIKVTDKKLKVLKGYQWQRVKVVRDKTFSNTWLPEITPVKRLKITKDDFEEIL